MTDEEQLEMARRLMFDRSYERIAKIREMALEAVKYFHGQEVFFRYIPDRERVDFSAPPESIPMSASFYRICVRPSLALEHVPYDVRLLVLEALIAEQVEEIEASS